MPITKRAIKKMHSDVGRTKRNKKVRQSIQSAVKIVRQSPSGKNLTNAFGALDRAVKRHVIHKNKASRVKARLAKLITKT